MVVSFGLWTTSTEGGASVQLGDEPPVRNVKTCIGVRLSLLMAGSSARAACSLIRAALTQAARVSYSTRTQAPSGLTPSAISAAFAATVARTLLPAPGARKMSAWALVVTWTGSAGISATPGSTALVISTSPNR